MGNEQYTCGKCWLFINVENVKFEGEDKTPHCPECGKIVTKACPNDHCHCSHPVTGGFAYCRICGQAMCPQCYSHDVFQLSRITGYYANVSGFNSGKRAELVDRHHTENKEVSTNPIQPNLF